MGGIVHEVYQVSRWYTSPNYAARIEFEGEVAEFKIRSLFIGKMIPECHRQKGLASPFLYKKKAGATSPNRNRRTTLPQKRLPKPPQPRKQQQKLRQEPRQVMQSNVKTNPLTILIF